MTNRVASTDGHQSVSNSCCLCFKKPCTIFININGWLFLYFIRETSGPHMLIPDQITRHHITIRLLIKLIQINISFNHGGLTPILIMLLDIWYFVIRNLFALYLTRNMIIKECFLSSRCPHHKTILHVDIFRLISAFWTP